jgi:hypothetical protein
MTDQNQNVCPYCGEAGFMRVEHVDAHNCFITCTNCAAGGPVHFGGSDSAIDAFCHPAHLMEGKVMVGVEDARLVVECCEKWDTDDALHLDAAERIQAAIDAAKGE